MSQKLFTGNYRSDRQKIRLISTTFPLAKKRSTGDFFKDLCNREIRMYEALRQVNV